MNSNKYIKNPLTAAVIALSAGIAAPMCVSCSGGVNSSANNADSLPRSVTDIVRAITADDSAAFARLVSYPLLRPYPLHDIETPAQMTSYYKVLIDDSLRSLVTSGNTTWDEYGWRGWTLGDGSYLWIDDGKLYDVSYISESERAEINRLIQLEIASLRPELRNGWTPVACLADTTGTSVYRIDEGVDTKGTPLFRLAVYASREQMHERPDAVFTGYRHSEGTASIVTYRFRTPGNEEVTYQADVPDGSLPELIFSGSSDTTITVRPAYWLDILP